MPREEARDELDDAAARLGAELELETLLAERDELRADLETWRRSARSATRLLALMRYERDQWREEAERLDALLSEAP
jgi:hypothetical protein